MCILNGVIGSRRVELNWWSVVSRHSALSPVQGFHPKPAVESRGTRYYYYCTEYWVVLEWPMPAIDNCPQRQRHEAAAQPHLPPAALPAVMTA